MLQRNLQSWVRLTILVAIFTPAASVEAAFHLWQFTEVFSNADGSVQFIEMRAPFNNEHFLSGHSLTSNGATFNVTTNLPNSQTANKSFIFATSAFAALPGAVTPDYVIPANFFNPGGDRLDWAAPSDFLIIGAGQLPVDGVRSLLRNGTTADNSPTNFAGAVGHVDLRAPVAGDTNGDRLVDVVDLNNVRNNFGATGLGVLGDTNNDNEVNIADLNSVRNNFGFVAAKPVPEPSSLAILAAGLTAAAWALRRTHRLAFCSRGL